MSKIMISPNKYVQGPGALKEIGEHVSKLGDSALVLGGRTALSVTSDVIEENFKKASIGLHFEKFNGECCDTEINRLKTICEEKGSNVIVGVGGGKVIDAAKATAYEMELPVVIVPTIAATDAPCSALSVIYTEEGVFDRYLILPNNPNLVLVDTDIIAKAPVRFLVSGMGDALATWFEADACKKSYAKNIPGGLTTDAALELAHLCYKNLIEYGYQAKLAVERKVSTTAVEKVVEANTLLSGLGFESSGLAAAHAVHNGLTVLEETHEYYHGEKVAFGTLVQLVMENRSMEEIYEVLDFCDSVGLPVNLEEIGVKEVTKEKIMKVAEAACAEGETIHNMPFPVTPEFVSNCIISADAIGKEYRKGNC